MSSEGRHSPRYAERSLKNHRNCVFVLLFLIACAGAQPESIELRVVETSASTPPDWLSASPSMDDQYAAVGVATNAPSLEDGIGRARLNAIAQIIEQAYGVEAASTYNRERTAMRVYIRDRLEGASQGTIREMRTEWYWRRYQGGFFDVWVLISVARTVIDKLIEQARQDATSTSSTATRQQSRDVTQSACVSIRIPNPRSDISPHWYDTGYYSLSRGAYYYYPVRGMKTWDEVHAEFCGDHPDQAWCTALILQQWCGNNIDDTRPECALHRRCALERHCASTLFYSIPDHRCLELETDEP